MIKGINFSIQRSFNFKLLFVQVCHTCVFLILDCLSWRLEFDEDLKINFKAYFEFILIVDPMLFDDRFARGGRQVKFQLLTRCLRK